MFQEGLNNVFFPIEIGSAYAYSDFTDYWLSYLGKDIELNQRIKKRKITG